MHRSRIGLVLIDHPASSWERASTFWAAVQNAEVTPEDDAPYAAVGRSGGLRVETQRLDSPDRPRVHLDIETDDVRAEIARLVDLGARVVIDHDSWAVLEDPGGLVFCVVPVQTGELFEQHALEHGRGDGS